MAMFKHVGGFRTLTALALIFGTSPAMAATITVEGSCGLANAIEAANSDAPVGGCVAGAGADTIVLPEDATFTLTDAAIDFEGPTGLPLVTSTVTIEGNGSVIERDPEADRFRILATSYADLTLRDLTIAGGNVRTDGGGIFNDGGDLTLERCVITDNEATTGGGISNYWGYFEMHDTLVVGNRSSNFGGGVESIGAFLISRSTFLDNDGGNWGGGLEFFTFGYEALITDSTFSGNVAALNGGGISQAAESAVVLVSTTITGNIAGSEGGGIYSAGYPVTLSRSVISGNEAPAGREAALSDFSDSSEFTLFGHDGDSGLAFFTPSPTDIIPSESLAQILDPVPRDNGGHTHTHMLPLGSPALDVTGSVCTPTDQHGVTRPQGAACDLGAVERVVDPCPNAAPSSGCTVNGVSNQLCRGTSANDVIVGTAGADVILGLGGNDTIQGGRGNDVLCGGTGNDDVRGQVGNDNVFGNGGSDTLFGGLGADGLDGGPGVDSCTRDEAD
ncbi:MAG TPA: choice-of-anchor Q domain-containing protein, partial [Polyangiaceae bacterium]|nr:choice-of-anchor Q domain-containing protein [Polyangiaceae bacterium]